jgi:acetoin utilization protein AcuB
VAVAVVSREHLDNISFLTFVTIGNKMRVRDIMSTNVIAVDENTSIRKARKIMEAHKIRRLPVMKKDKLVGLVTEHMLLEAWPSSARELSIPELDDLLDKMTVKEIMVKEPYAISPDIPPEEVLKLGQEMGYGGFPVVEYGRLIGVVTESDIVRLMTRILGVTKKGKRITIKGSNVFGNMHKIMSILDRNKTVLLSLMSLEDPEEKEWLIVLRLKNEDVEAIAEELKSVGFNVLYVG